MTAESMGDELMAHEGVIKFKCRWKECNCISSDMIQELQPIRARLWKLGWIGEDAQGISFGNVSYRFALPSCLGGDHSDNAGFLVTGSQTGKFPEIGSESFAFVYEWSTAGNWVSCIGNVKASSESLTHAAIYEASHRIKGIIHIHCHELWSRYAGILPHTRDDVSYGTPEMAVEIRKLIHRQNLEAGGVAIMGGHPDGLVAWGPSLQDALDRLECLLGERVP